MHGDDEFGADDAFDYSETSGDTSWPSSLDEELLAPLGTSDGIRYKSWLPNAVMGHRPHWLFCCLEVHAVAPEPTILAIGAGNSRGRPRRAMFDNAFGSDPRTPKDEGEVMPARIRLNWSSEGGIFVWRVHIHDQWN